MAELTRRTLLAGAGGAFLGGRAPAVLAQTTPSASGTVTVMGYPGAFKDKFMALIAAPFQQKFPNIKVSYYDGGNSAQMVGMLRSQRNDPQVDVAIIDASVTASVNQEGLFEPLSANEIPVLPELLPIATELTKGYGPSITFDSSCLLYDPAKVKLTSLAQLWDKQLANQIAISGPPNIQGIAFTLVVNKMAGGDYKTSIDPAISKLRELAPSVTTFEPSPDGTTLLLNGAVAVCTGWNARSQIRRDEVGDRLGILIPPEGAVVIMDTINVVKGGKNKAAALAFTNYALSAEAQKTFAEATFYGATNSKAEVSPAVLQRSIASPALKSSIIPIDWAIVSPLRDEWTQRWRREVIPMSRR
jgi:putative spermidine/putrescine transport system substrate-binding protein